MSAGQAFAAVDLGADSGRVALGRLQADRVELSIVHRFPNRPLRLLDGLHWRMMDLFSEVLRGLALARQRAGSLAGIGVDAWAVDYGLLDERDGLLGPPFHYRDARTKGMIERASALVSPAEMYATTGTQALPINTVFQLLSEAGSRRLASAERLLLIPDLVSLWLCGARASERTVASTTGLLDARSGGWALDLAARLGLPAAVFGELVDPGTVLGRALEHLELGRAPVIATAGHDTAAAFAAAPLADERSAVLSSGTWSLLGLEVPEPDLGQAAREANLTNELGAGGGTRLLKNIMGLWLVQECRRAWARQGKDHSYEELMRLAATPRSLGGEEALLDPDQASLLAPGDMPARIAAICTAGGQAAPSEPGDVVRSILVSLACKYRYVLELLERVSGRAIERIHMIGGGAKSKLLCQLTADLLGLPVEAGPVEATALGNVLLQARAKGELGSYAEVRALALASTRPVTFEPAADRDLSDRRYSRFLAVTGIASVPAAAVEADR